MSPSKLLTRHIHTLGALAFLGCAAADRSDVAAARSAISAKEAKDHVRFLAHDSLRGRNTGERGYEIARDYVAAQFKSIGLEPGNGESYLQPFDLLVGRVDRGSILRTRGIALKAPEATFTPDWTGQQATLRAEGVFVGFGLSSHGRDDYAGADVRGKVVWLIPGAPPGWLDDGDRARMLRSKLENAHQRGAVAVVMMQAGPAAASDEAWARQASRPATPTVLADGTAPSFRADATVGPEAARRLLGAWGYPPSNFADVVTRGFPARQVGPVELVRRHQVDSIQSWNVVGLVRGRDPKLREEVVIYTAHLDHVGVGEPDANGDSIYNGAHDNALGIGKLLGTAKAMKTLAPRRTILFMAAGAEERGLLGAWYYVRHPLFPIERTAAAINQDGGLEGAATDDIFAFGADQSDVEKILDQVGVETGMRVNREFKAPFSPSQALLFRSDQYPFLLAGVPAIYLMDGFSVGGNAETGRLQWDAYIKNVNHQQRDNFDDAWTFESVARMAGFALSLGYELANRDEMPQMSEQGVMHRPRGVPSAPYFRRP